MISFSSSSYYLPLGYTIKGRKESSKEGKNMKEFKGKKDINIESIINVCT